MKLKRLFSIALLAFAAVVAGVPASEPVPIPLLTLDSVGLQAPPRADDGVYDGLAEVNAKRATRSLRPYIRDEALTQAARGAAAFRAKNLMFGHTSNDFGFVPAGTTAATAGCAAYPPSYGWLSCCIWENYRYGGAAWAMGRDSKRYMHLYVK